LHLIENSLCHGKDGTRLRPSLDRFRGPFLQ